MEQIGHNSQEQAVLGRYPSRLYALQFETIQDNEQLLTETLEDGRSFESFGYLLGE